MAPREFFLIEFFKIFDCSPLQAENIVIEFTEILMAKAGIGNAGFDKCFHGKIKVNDGFIFASASGQYEPGEILDEMVLLILDYDLYSITRTNPVDRITGIGSN